MSEFHSLEIEISLLAFAILQKWSDFQTLCFYARQKIGVIKSSEMQ